MEGEKKSPFGNSIDYSYQGITEAMKKITKKYDRLKRDIKEYVVKKYKLEGYAVDIQFDLLSETIVAIVKQDNAFGQIRPASEDKSGRYEIPFGDYARLECLKWGRAGSGKGFTVHCDLTDSEKDFLDTTILCEETLGTFREQKKE